MTKFHPRPLSLSLLLALVAIPAVSEEKWKSEELSDREKKEASQDRIAEKQEIKSQFEYSFNEISRKLVTVSCTGEKGRSSGSGFIATMDGKTYLFTNQHVILGSDTISFKTAAGETLRPRSVELAASRDIARLLLADETEAFEITREMSIGSSIGCFGNSEGGGVATELYGKVTSVGSEIVEVSADFVFGNSGSPILNLDQEVIGIATFVRSFSDDEDGSKTRRFGYRLTGNQWKSVNWKKYNEKYGKRYLDNEQLVESILDITRIWHDDPFSRMTANDHPDAGLRKWATDHNHTINRITRLNDKGRASSHELNNTNKQIKKNMGDSATALSAVCRSRARQMRLLSKQRDLSGFLREKFEGFAERLDSAARKVDRHGDKLTTIDYFHFKKNTN